MQIRAGAAAISTTPGTATCFASWRECIASLRLGPKVLRQTRTLGPSLSDSQGA
jgi:hypothetical protein